MLEATAVLVASTRQVVKAAEPVKEWEAFKVPSLFFCGGVAQTCHDDRVVELKEQLVVEEK